MNRFIEGESRTQATLFPERLDDWIAEDNPVRAVDAFVDELDLAQLGFEGAEPAATGRPAYQPGTLLKIYVYGYLNRIASSRRLERETQRNLELIWLTGRLTPDFKTIADFRRDNGPAIRQTCRQFVLLCREIGLFEPALVAIDGSKFKAVNNRDKNFTPHKLKARQQQLDESIARYLADLDRADRDPSLVPEERTEHLKEKLVTVRAQMKKLEAIGRQLAASPDQQVSLTDPDARSMATSGRGTGMVGHNVQASVDTEHHLIVAHEVTNEGHDRAQLTAMAQQTREALGTKDLKVLADRGYFSGEEILKCEQAGMTPLVPKPLTNNSATSGRFTSATSSTTRSVIVTAALRASTPSGGSPRSRKAWRSTSTGRRRARSARSTAPVRPATTGASRAGSTKPSSSGCIDGSIGCPKPADCGDRPSSTPSAPSNRGWERRTS